MATWIVCPSTVVVSLDSLFPIQSISYAVETQVNTEVDPNDPELADEKDMQIKYSSG
jgi:hypothetical protein